MTGSSPYILWFEDFGMDALPRVGGKNASLGEMMRAGIRVPPGFAVTTDAYSHFLAHTGILNEIRTRLSHVDPDDLESLEAISRDIRELMSTTPVPEEIERAIIASYETLAERCGVPDLPVAVRSSATAEDLPGASFAGQQETSLWVMGGSRVLIRTLTCWSSLFTPRAISYRLKMGFPHEQMRISVGIQKMANACTAGVMFTLNPRNGDRSKIVLEGSWGLGESVVAGVVTPDSYLIDKVTLEILQRTISPKLSEYVVCYDGLRNTHVAMQDVPESRQTVACLGDAEIVELARLGKRIERHYGKPMDIEWAIDQDLEFPENVMILQARPETVWSQKKMGPIVKPQESALGYIADHLLSRLGHKILENSRSTSDQ